MEPQEVGEVGGDLASKAELHFRWGRGILVSACYWRFGLYGRLPGSHNMGERMSFSEMLVRKQVACSRS